jgi:hypothetical protein
MRRNDRFSPKNTLLVSGLSIVAVWLLFSVIDLGHKAEIAWSAAQSAKAEARSLSSREALLTKHINDLNSARGQDAAIRTAFDVARPGEEVIVVVPPTNIEATTSPSWWDRHFGWLGL